MCVNLNNPIMVSFPGSPPFCQTLTQRDARELSNPRPHTLLYLPSSRSPPSAREKFLQTSRHGWGPAFTLQNADEIFSTIRSSPSAPVTGRGKGVFGWVWFCLVLRRPSFYSWAKNKQEGLKIGFEIFQRSTSCWRLFWFFFF